MNEISKEYLKIIGLGKAQMGGGNLSETGLKYLDFKYLDKEIFFDNFFKNIYINQN